MYYGIPTLLEFESIEECAKLCNELGLSFVEINMNLPIYSMESLDSSELNRIAEKYKISYTFHLDENLDISDFNPLVSQAYIDTVLAVIKLAKKVNASIVNMHLAKGVYFTLPDEKVYLYEKYEVYYIESVKKFIKLCEDEIMDENIKITIENTGGFTGFQLKALALMLESKVFGLCYDLGHDYKHGKPDECFMLENKNKLYHIHFHDATNKNDHLSLGEGENDLVKYLYIANKLDCTVVLETKTAAGLKKSVKWLENTPLPLVL